MAGGTRMGPEDEASVRRSLTPTRVIGDALGLLGCVWRPVYRFAFAVTSLTALVGGGITAAGFAMAWGAFEDARRDAERAMAAGDSYVAYADQWGTLHTVGAVVLFLLLVLTALVLAVLHTAQSVAVSHALADRGSPGDRGSLGTAELWQRTRPHLPAAFCVQVLTGLSVVGVMLPGLVLWQIALYRGEEDRLDFMSTSYLVAGWVLLFTVMGLGLILYFRLSLATAAMVNRNSSPASALRRSWALTRGSTWKTSGICLLITAMVAIAFTLLQYAAGPIAHPAGLAMMWLSGGNVYITGVLVLITPTAVATLMLPLVILPQVCSVIAFLHAELEEQHAYST